MRSPSPFSYDMSEVCRLCLSSDEEKLPIFGEDQASLHRTPLPFRILACVSVEVSSQDILPTVICKECLQQVNQWHDFKQVCDSSQATLKQWLCQAQTSSVAATSTSTSITTTPNSMTTTSNATTSITTTSNTNTSNTTTSDTTTPDTTSSITNTTTTTTTTTITLDQVVIKQEPVEVDEDSVFQDDVQGVCGDSREYCMLDVKQEEIEVCEENPVEAHDVPETADPLDVPAGRNGKSPSQSQEEHNFYNSTVVADGNSSSFEYDDGEIDFMRVNHGGAISVQGLFDSSESTVLGNKPVQPKKKRRFFRRITFKKKKKKSPPIWTPQEVGVQSQYTHLCRKCGESFPELWLLKSHEKSHSIPENVCTICEKRFSSKGGLVRHIRLHTLQLPYSCPKCSTSFSNKSAYLQYHQNRCPLDDPPRIPLESTEKSPDEVSALSCYICQETFPTMNQLIQHRKGHVNYSCPKCKKHFNGGKALSNHLRIHKLGAMMAHKMVHGKAPSKVLPVPNMKKPLSCSVCNKVFPSIGVLHRHMAKHTQSKEFTCYICHATMGYATSLHKHMKNMHNMTMDYSSIKATSAASEDSASQDSSSLQDLPLQVKSEEVLEAPAETVEEHVCTICNKVFGQKSLLVSHLKVIHMGVKTYKCTACAKMFASKPLLLLHMQSHTEGRISLSCKICCKTFTSVKTYNKHKGVHTRYRCFTCGICSQSFNGINSWQAHQVTHLPDLGHAPMMNITKQEVKASTGKYTCRLCFKMYRSRAELYEHKKMHIKLKIYSCTECKNSYNSLATLMKHKRREHPNDEQYFDMGLMSEDAHNCEFCGKSFNSSSSLSKHKLVHAELLYTNVTRVVPPSRRRALKRSETYESSSPLETNEPFVCVPCNRSFMDEMSLKTHRGWHKRKRSSPFNTLQLKGSGTPSPVKVSADSPNKDSVNTPRSAVESYEKDSFWCVECNKGFKKSVNLSRHFKLSHRHNSQRQGQAENFDSSFTKDFCNSMPVEVQLMEGEMTDNEVKEAFANGFNAGGASADDLAEETAIANDTIADGVSEDDVAVNEPPAKAIATTLAVEDGSVLSDKPANNSSLDDATSNNFTADDVPPDDTLEQVSTVVCMDDIANESNVGDGRTNESSLGSVSQEEGERPQENGVESLNGKQISTGRQKQVFECALCNKIFKSKNALVRHKGWHSRSPSARLKSSLLELVPKSSVPFDNPVTTESASSTPPPGSTTPKPTQLYPCATCGNSFSSVSSLNKHKRLHLSPTPTVPVNRCLRPKESVRPPERMLPEFEVQSSFKCSTCKKYYSSAKSLYKHQKLHMRKILPVYAKLLPDGLSQPTDSVPGLSKRLIPTKYRCSTCGLYYSSSETLSRHNRLHIRHLNAVLPDEETTMTPAQLPTVPTAPQRVSGKYRCDLCLKYYSCRSNLYRHRRLHSRQQQVKPVTNPPAETTSVIPPQNINQTLSSEQVPVPSPARQQVQTAYQCDVCKKYYSCSTSLSKHRRLHVVRPLPAPVKEVREDNSSVQEETGSGFPCPYCSKTFSKQKNLSLHIRCHTGERPYICNLCPQAFTRYNTLWKHKKRVHLNWTYTCTTCGRLFPFKNVLDVHVRNVHQTDSKKSFRFSGVGAKKALLSGMGNYPCGNCKKSFVYFGALLTHERVYHGK